MNIIYYLGEIIATFIVKKLILKQGKKWIEGSPHFLHLGDFMGGYWRGSGTVTSQLNQPEKVTVDKLSIIPEIPGVANEGLTAKKHDEDGRIIRPTVERG